MLQPVDDFFDGTFDRAGTFWAVSGSSPSSSIRVIYDSIQMQNPLGLGLPFSNYQPRAMCKTADVSNATTSSWLIVSGVAGGFRIKEVLPDATGITVLELTEDAHGE